MIPLRHSIGFQYNLVPQQPTLSPAGCSKNIYDLFLSYCTTLAFLNPTRTGLFENVLVGGGGGGGGFFSTSPRKILSRQPRPIKFDRLIASIKFYKACNFENQIL